MDSLLASRSSVPIVEESLSRKRSSYEDNKVIEIIDARSRSHLEKKIRIQPERIPDGTIIHGNISQSALAFDHSDKGPSSFTGIILFVC